MLFGLEAEPPALEAALSLLSHDERRRADRFRFPDDRRRFAVARATLRRVLGECLDLPPASLCFDYGAHGKPVLAGEPTDGSLCFNASHTGERLLIGLARGSPIGVDIERHRTTVSRDGLVRRYFSVAENAAYFALPEPDRQQGFFDCWARKEAVVKAIGQGLAFPLKEFDVGFVADSPGLLRLQGEEGIASGWCLGGIEVGAGYSAAVVVQGKNCMVRPSD